MSENDNDDFKTGLDWVDQYPVEERRKIVENFKASHASLTPEQRKDSLEHYYRVVFERRKKEPLLTSGQTDREIIRDVLNAFDPEVLKKNAIDEAERNGRLDIAQDLRKRRLGFDLCHISLYDQDTGEEIF